MAFVPAVTPRTDPVSHPLSMTVTADCQTDRSGSKSHPHGRPVAVFLLGAALLLASTACRRETGTTPPAPTPVSSLETLLRDLSENRPESLWEALPPSYQADVRGLIAAFCDRVDTNLYDQTFRVLDKAVRVLREKKEFLFNSPLTLDNPIFETPLGLHWEETVSVMEPLVRSELATVEGLRHLDPGRFLATTGRRFLENLESLVEAMELPPARNPWLRWRQALEATQLRFLPMEDGSGILTWAPPGADLDPQREIRMVRVEGTWVPAELAARWQEGVARLRAGIQAMNNADSEKIRPILAMTLSTLERAMDALLQARSQKEFDTILQSLEALRQLGQTLRRGGTTPSGGSSGSPGTP